MIAKLPIYCFVVILLTVIGAQVGAILDAESVGELKGRNNCVSHETSYQFAPSPPPCGFPCKDKSTSSKDGFCDNVDFDTGHRFLKYQRVSGVTYQLRTCKVNWVPLTCRMDLLYKYTSTVQDCVRTPC